MKRVNAIVPALLVAVVGCGDRGEAPETPSQAAPTEVVAPPPTIEAAAPAPTSARGEASVRAEADGGTAPQGQIELSWDDDGKLKGQLTLGADSYSISGIRTGAEIRGWVRGDGTARERSGRGTLLGLDREGRLSGEFVISESGGDTVYLGSWTAASD